MELQGIQAFGFVLLIFVIGMGAGMVFAGWTFAMILRRSGYKLNELNLIVPLPYGEVENE